MAGHPWCERVHGALYDSGIFGPAAKDRAKLGALVPVSATVASPMLIIDRRVAGARRARPA
jgi:hypothetical protein